MKVIIRHPARKVILQAEGKREAIESAHNQVVEVCTPELPIVVPQLVFQFTAKIASHAADFVCRLFFDAVRQLQRLEWIAAISHSLSRFEECIDQASWISCRNENRRCSADPSGCHFEALRRGTRCPAREPSGKRGIGISHNDAMTRAFSRFGRPDDLWLHALRTESVAEVSHGSHRRRTCGCCIFRIDYQTDPLGGRTETRLRQPAHPCCAGEFQKLPAGYIASFFNAHP